jgi:methyl acetate hydrolase
MLTRRELGQRTGAMFGAGLLGSRNLRAASGAAMDIEKALRASRERRKIPAVAVAVARNGHTVYEGALGERDSASGIPVGPGSIFAIASMTKPVTTVAAMQLVEQGKLKLDEPASRYLPPLGKLQVLQGFDSATGKPRLSPASRPVTLRRLLSHTSGFAYDTWNAEMFQYGSAPGVHPRPGEPPPLAFEPGRGWAYGTGVDWAGRIVERVSGLTLEQYFQQRIFELLDMRDTSYILPPAKFGRFVSTYQRQGDGSLQEIPSVQPPRPSTFGGGGGLYTTTGDYVRFMQMILRHGSGPGRRRILRAETVSTMTRNQIGTLSAGKLKSVRPNQSADADFHPGFTDGFGLGFLINGTAYEGGRSAGSLAWAGIQNTFFWIDPQRQICAVVMMHVLPFCDPQAVGLLGDFERVVYAQLGA